MVFLKERELAIVRLVGIGLKNRTIAERTGLKEGTVKNYLKNIFDKTGMDGRFELALWWVHHKEEYGLVSGINSRSSDMVGAGQPAIHG
jgi:DNA-binding NarL/FixJ family response regulator